MIASLAKHGAPRTAEVLRGLQHQGWTSSSSTCATTRSRSTTSPSRPPMATATTRPKSRPGRARSRRPTATSCSPPITTTAIPALLKNALDHAFPEFNRKPVAFVGYGNVGGAKAIEQLRLVSIELEMAPLRHAVHILPDAMRPVRAAGVAFDVELFASLDQRLEMLATDLSWWADALRQARTAAKHAVATGSSARRGTRAIAPAWTRSCPPRRCGRSLGTNMASGLEAQCGRAHRCFGSARRAAGRAPR
jgi:hypothetical protein